MPETATKAKEAESLKEVEAKDRIHAAIRDMVKEKTGTSIGITGGKEIFDSVVAELFSSTVKDGSFRFPGGHGSLKVVQVAAGKKTLPNGRVIDAPARRKLRYDGGTVVRGQLSKG